MTIGQLIFGIVTFILLIIGIVSLNNQDENGQTNVYTKLSFFIGIVTLFAAIFDPLNTPKIQFLNDNDYQDEENSQAQHPTDYQDGQDSQIEDSTDYQDGQDFQTEDSTDYQDDQDSQTEDSTDYQDGQGSQTEDSTDYQDGQGSQTEDSTDYQDGQDSQTEDSTDYQDGQDSQTEDSTDYQGEENPPIKYLSPSFPITSRNGNVEYLSSAYDIDGNEHTDVLYMEGGNYPSITIYTNGDYSNISFKYYAILGMDPAGRNSFRVYIDNYEFEFDERAGIPESNPHGEYSQSIVGATTVKIEFTGDYSTDDNPCALLLSDLEVY